jgi:hypothetical protein
MKTLKLTLIATSIVLLGACATKPVEPPKVVPPPTDVTLDEPNTAIENGVSFRTKRRRDGLPSRSQDRRALPARPSA